MKTRKSTLIAKTLRGIFMMLALAGISVNSFAQSKELHISPLRFAGVHALTSGAGESSAYMVLHHTGGGNWNFNLLNNTLDPINQGTIEAPRYSFFNTLTTSGDYTLLSFVVNAMNPSLTFVVMNPEGNEVARSMQQDTPMLRRGEQFFPAVFAHPQEGFLISQTIKSGRSAGYKISHVSPDLDSKWEASFLASRGHAHIYDVAVNKDKVFILEATERMNRTQNTRIHCLDATTGTRIYTLELNDNTSSFFPTAMLPRKDGSIALSGTYFNGTRINSKNTRGIFFMTLGPDGTTTALQTQSWALLRPVMRTSVPDWFFKVMPDVWIHAIEPMEDGSYTAIAELYRYSGEVRREEKGELKERYHRIRMLDFMLLQFSSEGEMLFADRIEKPHMVLKLDAELAGGSGSLSDAAGSGPLRRGRAMKNAGAFSYRFHQKTQDGFQLAFSSYEAKKHYAYLMNTHDLSAAKAQLTHAKPRAISYLEIIDLCANQQGFGFILTELNTRNFDDSEAYWRGILPGSGNSMVTYEYMPLTGKLQLNLQKMHPEL